MDTANYRTTYHQDGTVTLWDTYSQRWRRLAADSISAELLATLTDDERESIAKMKHKHRAVCIVPESYNMGQDCVVCVCGAISMRDRVTGKRGSWVTG